jgi:hypothetical protein
MSVFGAPSDGAPSSGGRMPLLVALLAAALLLASVAWWLSRAPDEAPAIEADRSQPTAPETAEPVDTVADEPTATEARATPREPRPAPTPEAPPPAPPAGPLLRVDSDVPGAFVFVDRKFVGETPLETRAVDPGSHQVNVSADGYDGVSRTVEIAESGATELTVELKTVRLDASVEVVHKHGFGSCKGRLTAGLEGLRYVTDHSDDAFQIPFSALDTFEVDYLDKNLRVKQRGGRTWNFTTEAENADSLFVFHRDVEQAREKLASRR